MAYVYILGNNKFSLYIGVTHNLIKRVFQHKNKQAEGFTKKYNIDRLLYDEFSDDITTAIEREKQLKRWHREWKLNLIKSKNSELKDLYPDLYRS
ncbi:MAG TPA: GIY-YIG nuclease family protein [Patescibacteria group bacterium]|nr:GIY-YIG nuclease family protein [Patescibacteria group bacterium]